MSPPSSVTVALSAEESRSLREAAGALSVAPEKLLAAAAVTFARLCGFRKTASASVRRSPNWGPPPESALPEEILDVPLDADTAEQVEAAAGYVRWEGPDGVLSVTLPEYVVGAAMRLLRERRAEGSPRSYQGLADQLFAGASSRVESAPPPSRTAPAGFPAQEPPLPQPAPAPAPERPAYTLPRREQTESEGREAPRGKTNRNPARAPAKGKVAQPDAEKRARGSSPPPRRNRASGPAEPSPPSAVESVGVLAWVRQRPLVLGAGAAALLLLVVLVAAYAAATAPPESRHASSAPEAPVERLSDKREDPGHSLVLDPAPRGGETAAAAMKHWEDITPAGPEVAATTSKSKKRNNGKNIDALLNERYGRPKVLADASLKPEAYDADIAAAVADVVHIYPVPPALVKAVIRRESNYNPNAMSQVGAIGMMQLMPYTAKKVGLRLSDLWVPKKNILGGTRLLSALLQYYDGDVISALTAYNARPREPLAPLPKNGETPEYVAAVLRYYEEYNGGPLQKTGRGNSLDLSR
jgi:hypothetical protein